MESLSKLAALCSEVTVILAAVAMLVKPLRNKLGFDWRIFTVNDVDVRKDYVEQETPVGASADNPIEYTEGVPLINNAFYRVDGVVKVYMDGWVDWEG